MKFTVHISTDNAAFHPVSEDEEFRPGPEVARILRELADQVEYSQLVPGVPIRLRDYNGNRVGYAELVDQ